jgi:hypothetical protein
MPLRGWVRSLERRSKRGLESFALLDGSRFYYDPARAYKDMFGYSYDALLGDPWPAPPEILRRLTEAADIRGDLAQLEPEHPEVSLVSVGELFDVDALVERRELVPRMQEPVEDLSEP